MEDPAQQLGSKPAESEREKHSIQKTDHCCWSWFSASTEDMIWSSETGQQSQSVVDYCRALLLMFVPFSCSTTLTEWEAKHKKQRKVKPLYKSLPLISCLRRSVSCFQPWPSMSHFYISEMQQLEVNTTSSHFKTAFVLDAPWIRFLQEKKNAITPLPAFKKMVTVKKTYMNEYNMVLLDANYSVM